MFGRLNTNFTVCLHVLLEPDSDVRTPDLQTVRKFIPHRPLLRIPLGSGSDV